MPDQPIPTVQDIPVDKIKPSPTQARKDFDPEELKSLSDSIRARGQLEPVMLRPVEGGFELVDGERRLRAIQQIGAATIKALVEDIDPKEATLRGFVANAQCKGLNPIERARSYKCLSDNPFSLSQEQIAREVGEDPATVFRFSELLKLPPEIQDHLTRVKLTETHMRYLNQIKDNKQMINLANKAAQEGWSVKETEKRVNQLLGRTEHAKKPKKASDSLPPAATKKEGQPDPLEDLWKMMAYSHHLPEHWVEYWGDFVWKLSVKAEGATTASSKKDLQIKLADKLSQLGDILKEAEAGFEEGDAETETKGPDSPLMSTGNDGQDEEPLDPKIAAMIARVKARRETL